MILFYSILSQVDRKITETSMCSVFIWSSFICCLLWNLRCQLFLS